MSQSNMPNCNQPLHPNDKATYASQDIERGLSLGSTRAFTARLAVAELCARCVLCGETELVTGVSAG